MIGGPSRPLWKQWRASTSTSVLAAVVLLSVLVGCGKPPASIAQETTPIKETTQNLSKTNIDQLILDLDAADAAQRAAATAELFRRGKAASDALTKHGAKAMATTSPPRRDVVLTLIEGLGLLGDQPYRLDSFGLHLEPGTTREQVVEMGRRHKFRLAEGAVFRPDAAPTVYVELTGEMKPTDASRLEEIIREVLSNEAAVRTVNLNYVEPA